MVQQRSSRFAVSLLLKLTVICVFCTSSPSVQASPTEIVGDLEKLSGLFNQVAPRSNQTVRLQYRSNIRGVGGVKFHFSGSQRPTWSRTVTDESGRHSDPTEMVLLKGIATRSSGRLLAKSFGVVTKRSDGRVILLITFPYQRSNSSVARLVSLEAKLGRVSSKRSVRSRVAAVSRSLPSTVVTGKVCSASESHRRVNLTSSQSLSTQSTGTQIVRLATDADYLYYSEYGESTNSVIAGLVMAASELYESEFGVKFQLATQNVFRTSSSNPYTSSSPEALLQQFQSYTLSRQHLGDADLYHLFTGVNISGSTIGVAYVGVVCQANNQWSFGLSQRVHPAADATILAHEVGHNFNAMHDVSDSGSIMYPSVTIPGSTRWSSQSRQEIRSFISGIGCLETEAPDTTSTPEPDATAAPDPTTGADSPTGNVPSSGNPNVSPTIPVESDFSVNLSARNRRGRLKASVAFEPWSTGCTILISGRAASEGSSIEVYSGPVVARELHFRSTSRRRSSSTLLLRAQVSCNSGTSVGVSEEVSIPMRGRSRRRVRVQKWLKQFARSFREARR